MKKKEKKIDANSYLCGYECGKQAIIDKILVFIDAESEFLPDIHSDALLDRLVKFIKKL